MNHLHLPILHGLQSATSGDASEPDLGSTDASRASGRGVGTSASAATNGHVSPNGVAPSAAGGGLACDGHQDGHQDAHDASEARMQVGDLARESGKTVRAIHLYEQLELLKPAARSKGRYRLYGPEALLRIRWIGKLQDLGLSLTDIKAIVRDVEQQGSAPTAMVKIREVYRQKLDETRAQIARLEALEQEMSASLEYLEACHSVCETDRLVEACQSCNHHPREQRIPDLVAGFRA